MLLTSVLPVTNALTAANTDWRMPLLLLRVIGTSSLAGAVILFPDGRFTPPWSRYVLLAAIFYTFLWLFIPDLVPVNTLDFRVVPGPANLVFQFIFFTMIVAIQTYRYRFVSTPVQRLQTRWVVLGLITLISTVSAVALTGIFWEPLRTSPTLFALYLIAEIPIVLFSLLLFPIMVAIAIMRYHLWDIDALVRRTLVYSMLTGLLAVIYFSGVALLQGVLTADRGQPTAVGGLSSAVVSQPSAVVIVLSTLAIAALVNPLRRRLQDTIDRLFYRQKYDAEKALADFAAAARSETDLAQLADRLTGTVQETMQPSQAFLWLRAEVKREQK
jgi:hypothetical protein